MNSRNNSKLKLNTPTSYNNFKTKGSSNTNDSVVNCSIIEEKSKNNNYYSSENNSKVKLKLNIPVNPFYDININDFNNTNDSSHYVSNTELHSTIDCFDTCKSVEKRPRIKYKKSTREMERALKCLGRIEYYKDCLPMEEEEINLVSEDSPEEQVLKVIEEKYKCKKYCGSLFSELETIKDYCIFPCRFNNETC